MMNFFLQINKGLIVSCQAEVGDPFDSIEGVTSFAKAAEKGGAVGIRSEGILKTKQIINNINIPVIGLVKSRFKDGLVRITGSFKDIEDLLLVSCKIIAVDGTIRKREGLTGPNFIERIKTKYSCIVVADISSLNEAEACFNSGADAIATTLLGYTPETQHNRINRSTHLTLINSLSNRINVPIIAEGHISTPQYASKAIEAGAWAVVVGAAITRPVNITQEFVKKLNRWKSH